MNLLLTLLILSSCTSQRIDRKINDVNWDSLADESYLRWGEERLEKNAMNEPKVIDCYQGKAKETLDLYKKEYLTKNQTPYYWLHIGNCYFVDESWSKAEFFYQMALDEAKTPTVKSIALNNLGLIHFKYEQWEKGKELINQSIKLAPLFKVPRFNLSQLYLQFGHYDKAIETLNAKVFVGQRDIDVFFSLANAYLYKGDLNTSEQYFKQIPEDHKRREDIAATYALFHIKKGNYEVAKNVMDNREKSGIIEITEISQKVERILVQKMKEE